MIVEHLGKKFYIDNKLAESIELYVDDMQDSEEDLLILLTGKEGAGKSKFSRQLAWYISYLYFKKYGLEITPNHNNIHFLLKQYMKDSLNGVKFQINIMDESRRVLNRKRSTSRDAVDFTDYLSENRDAQQIHIILLPAYHDIEKYILMWRSKMVIKLEKYRDAKTNKLVKGEGKVLPIDERLIYCWEENRYRYPKFLPSKYGGFQFKFPDYECFDDIDKYKEKKAKFRREKYSGDDVKLLKKEISIAHNLHKQGIQNKDIATAMGVHRNTVSSWLKEVKAQDINII